MGGPLYGGARAGRGMYGRVTCIHCLCAPMAYLIIYLLPLSIVVCLRTRKMVKPRHARDALAEKARDVHLL